jgi:hypothetical protein
MRTNTIVVYGIISSLELEYSSVFIYFSQIQEELPFVSVSGTNTAACGIHRSMSVQTSYVIAAIQSEWRSFFRWKSGVDGL